MGGVSADGKPLLRTTREARYPVHPAPGICFSRKGECHSGCPWCHINSPIAFFSLYNVHIAVVHGIRETSRASQKAWYLLALCKTQLSFSLWSSRSGARRNWTETQTRHETRGRSD